MTGKAFGVQTPTQGETAVSWQTWTNGSGSVPPVSGDADWGKLMLGSANEGRSAVYDHGSAVARKYTLNENRYGTGAGATVLQIRGDTSVFTQDATLPMWQTYTAPISATWRYVQVRETTQATLLAKAGGNRYLVNDASQPMFLLGEAGWSAVGMLTNAQIDTYLSDRASRGFNLVLFSVPEHHFATNAPNNIDGVAPFSGTAFQSSINDTYFQRVDYMVARAQELGIYLLFDLLYQGWAGSDDGWDTEMGAASTAQMQTWGETMAARYGKCENIIWVLGGDADLTSYLSKYDAIATGIRNYDTRHYIIIHGNRPSLGSDYMTSGRTWVDLESAYSDYLGTPGKCLDGYAAGTTRPVIQIEAYYENENSMTNQGLRAQLYWSAFSGAVGHVFGNNPVWDFGFLGGTWSTALASTGAQDMGRGAYFIRSKAWWGLVPDSGHTTLTSGYGTLGAADYAGCARASDGKLVLIYMPSNRTMTIDCTKLSGTFAARWWDPTNGSYVYIGSYANTGTQNFSRSTANSAGAADWVLVLEV